MKKTTLAATSVLAFVFGASFVQAESHGNAFVHSRTNNGQFYTMYQDHMSLYVYENDTAGNSSCYGECAENWPPALLPAGTVLGENYSLIQRDDGTFQAAYKDQPLYLSVLDNKIGDTNGDGVDNNWFLARPDLM